MIVRKTSRYRVVVWTTSHYGVARVSMIDQVIGLFLQSIVSFVGLFCKREL